MGSSLEGSADIPYTIYGISSPHDASDIRYIGRTKYPLEVRLKQHIASPDCHSSVKNIWIRALKEQGLQPTIQHLKSARGLALANKIELETIHEYALLGFDLVNTPQWEKHSSRSSLPKYTLYMLRQAYHGAAKPPFTKKLTDREKKMFYEMLYYFQSNWDATDILGLASRPGLMAMVDMNSATLRGVRERLKRKVEINSAA